MKLNLKTLRNKLDDWDNLSLEEKDSLSSFAYAYLETDVENDDMNYIVDDILNKIENENENFKIAFEKNVTDVLLQYCK